MASAVSEPTGVNDLVDFELQPVFAFYRAGKAAVRQVLRQTDTYLR